MGKEHKTMYKQFMSIKEKNKDSIILFSSGNFYQMYYHDAIIGEKELGLNLSIRSLGNKHYTICTGFPTIAVEERIKALVKKNYKVIVCNAIKNKELNTITREICTIHEPNIDQINLENEWNEFFEKNKQLQQEELRENFNIKKKKPKSKETVPQTRLEAQVVKVNEMKRAVSKTVENMEGNNLVTITPRFDLKTIINTTSNENVATQEELTLELQEMIASVGENNLKNAISLYYELKALDVLSMTPLNLTMQVCSWKERY